MRPRLNRATPGSLLVAVLLCGNCGWEMGKGLCVLGPSGQKSWLDDMSRASGVAWVPENGNGLKAPGERRKETNMDRNEQNDDASSTQTR